MGQCPDESKVRNLIEEASPKFQQFVSNLIRACQSAAFRVQRAQLKVNVFLFLRSIEIVVRNPQKSGLCCCEIPLHEHQLMLIACQLLCVFS